MVVIVVNKFAGRKMAWKNYRKNLYPVIKDRVKDFVEISEDSACKMQDKLRNLLKKGFNTFVVVGGDGTLNKVAEVIKGSRGRIIPYPSGTGNDFVKSLGKEHVTAYHVVDCIYERCKNIEVDIGYVKIKNKKYIFINSLGIGFDADVLNTLPKIPLLRGDALYMTSVIINLFRKKGRRLRYKKKDVVKEGEYVVFDIGNGKFLGGGFKLFPKSSFNDGKLSYIGIKNSNIFKGIKALWDILREKIYTNPLIETGEFEKIELKFDRKVPFHTDGDIREKSDFFEVGLLREKLEILI